MKVKVTQYYIVAHASRGMSKMIENMKDLLSLLEKQQQTINHVESIHYFCLKLKREEIAEYRRVACRITARVLDYTKVEKRIKDLLTGFRK